MGGSESVYKVHRGYEAGFCGAATDVYDIGVKGGLGVWGWRRGGSSNGGGQGAYDTTMKSDFSCEVGKVEKAGGGELGAVWRGGRGG